MIGHNHCKPHFLIFTMEEFRVNVALSESQGHFQVTHIYKYIKRVSCSQSFVSCCNKPKKALSADTQRTPFFASSLVCLHWPVVGTAVHTHPSKMKTIHWLLRDSQDGVLKWPNALLVQPETEPLLLWPPYFSHWARKSMAQLFRFRWVWQTFTWGGATNLWGGVESVGKVTDSLILRR